MTSFTYSTAAQALQDEFDTKALATAVLSSVVHDALTPDERSFIERADMFWLASVDADGLPTVSYKGGAPGFVVAPDDRTILFPCYDGNGMFLSMGNIATTSFVGLLFMDFERPARLRAHGRASLLMAPEDRQAWPGAQFAVRIEITSLITNCPRYVPRMRRVEPSRYLPDESGRQQFPGWKRIETLQAVLPVRDQGLAQEAGGLITGEAWREMVKRGDPDA